MARTGLMNIGPSIIQNYNLAVNGGSSKGKYAVSIGYFDQNGVVINTEYSDRME